MSIAGPLTSVSPSAQGSKTMTKSTSMGAKRSAANRGRSHSMEHSPCPLFALPPELRIRIYEYVLACPGRNHDGIVELTNWNHTAQQDRRLNRRKRYSVLALLDTCRQIYKEAELVFYAVNHLSLPFFRSFFCSQRLISDWQYVCTRILERRLLAIERLTLYVSDRIARPGSGGAAAVIHFASRLPKLRVLHLGLCAIAAGKTPVRDYSRGSDRDSTDILKQDYDEVKPMLVQLGQRGLDDFRLVAENGVRTDSGQRNRHVAEQRLHTDLRGLERWETGLRSLVAEGMSSRGKVMKRPEIVVSAALPALRLGGKDLDERAEAFEALQWIEEEVRGYQRQ